MSKEEPTIQTTYPIKKRPYVPNALEGRAIRSSKKKRKLDPKIIRVGDIIQIDNPEMFVRCGYPLCLQDMYEEIETHFGKEIRDLVNSVANGDELVQSDQPFVMSKDYFSGKDSLNNSPIYRELAYHRLKKKGFGGNDRQIFTEKKESFLNARAKVEGIQIVKTGTRCSGYGGYDYTYGCEDYEPPYLSDQKTHKILRLGTLHYKNKGSVEGNWVWGSGASSIEAIHVTKLFDKETVERFCGSWDALEIEEEKEQGQ